MRILATGPESSGTRYLTRLLAAAGADAVHRSQPEGPDWIDVAAMADDHDAVVVVLRGLWATSCSSAMRGCAPDVATAEAKRRRALGRLAPVLGDPRTVVVTYESLAEPVERRALLRQLGLDEEAADAEPWVDANAQHYTWWAEQ